MKRLVFVTLAAAAILSSCCNGTKKIEKDLFGGKTYANRAEMIAAQIHDPHSRYVVVACHRGDWRNWPENSIPAIESIIGMGADIMELDLKLTKDSVLVLSHDATIDRCTNGKGRVSDFTLDSLRTFHLRRGHGVAIDTLCIPTLREALLACKDKICVNVDQGYEFYDMVLEITEELGVTDQILIKGKSATDIVAEKMAAHQHNMMYMPIVDVQSAKGVALFEEYLSKNIVPLAYEVCWKAEGSNVKEGFYSFEDAASKIIAQGSKVWVNTLWPSLCGGYGNDDDAAAQASDPAEVYSRYLENGVSMIQTDRPELLISYLRSVGRHN